MDDTTGDTVTPTGQENDAPVLRSVSQEQRLEIRRLMQQYRSQLGRRGYHIGGIDTRTGVTTHRVNCRRMSPHQASVRHVREI